MLGRLPRRVTFKKALEGQLPDVVVKSVEDTKWEKKDCGKCPSASKCNKGEKES